MSSRFTPVTDLEPLDLFGTGVQQYRSVVSFTLYMIFKGRCPVKVTFGDSCRQGLALMHNFGFFVLVNFPFLLDLAAQL